MYFDSFAAMLSMDGHGAYVWSAYAITLVVVGALLLVPLRRQRRLLTELSGELRRNRGAPSQGPSVKEEDSHASGT
ncbi:heme exporter protein CcmD [Pseudohalioglobus lutimaris]|uniref:Heme exporter protein D n=1 Tax=Pseudohalioglobus lutimaris TaxID=1737061 RepID=A0A2N5WYQ6_9GAMM|nr:heme exporter protein CcmD [Pseudohalioglobus lutimaris]PLW67366.1 heme exporter protein CcmD [Pseudohalioglobus lutimaris]